MCTKKLRERERLRCFGMHHKKSVKQELRVCVVTCPLQERAGSYYNLTLNFLKVLYPLVNEIFLITGNFPEKQIKNPKVHITNLGYKSKNSILTKILRYLVIQIQISYNLAKLNKKIDGCVFILSGAFLLPTLVTKMLRKKTVLTAVAPASKRAKYENTYLYSRVISILELFTLKLADKIVVEKPHVATFMKLNKYQNKICGEGCLFILNDSFKSTNKISERDNLVGYMGRLSEEKGVLNFVKAIPGILEERGETKFLVVGNGKLRDEVKKYLGEEHLNDNVKLIGRIPYEKVPNYLNTLKLSVLPSFTEGLPNIVLETMACGCVVLATPVGGIPDVIKDGETGFIMENNSPECIVKNVIRVLNYPDLDKIVKNARELVEKEFTYGAAVERYEKILENV